MRVNGTFETKPDPGRGPRIGRLRGLPLWGCALLAGPIPALAGQPPAWVSEGPVADSPSLAIDVPLEVLAGKLFVEVELGGKPRRFVFDTGSPSMLGKALTEELGLQAIDHRQGRDAHGAVIDTAIMQADIGLGDTLFRKVPVFVADFPPSAACLFDGVLGSELLPLCAWQIDLPEARLRCHADRQQLDHLSNADRLTLHDFGYPHAPILDVRFSDKARSKAMFDSGSSDYFAISAQDLEGARRGRGVGRSLGGQGSMGASLGGLATPRAQQRVVLEQLQIADLRLGPTEAVLRDGAPSLIGTGLLDHFVLTLDMQQRSAWLDRYRAGPHARGSFGFGLDFSDGPRVSLLWDDSPATAAGLKLGQSITTLNGSPLGGGCGDLRRALHALSEDDMIELGWQDGGATLQRAPPLIE